MLKSLLLDLIESRAADRGCRWLGGRGAILAYHNVIPDGQPAPALHNTVSQLRDQLSLLRDRGYSFIPLAEFFRRQTEGRSVAGCIAITFDDAYHGLVLAAPVLEQLSAPATVFVPTGSIGTGQFYWWDVLDRLTEKEALGIWPALGPERAEWRQVLRDRILAGGNGFPQAGFRADMSGSSEARDLEEWYRPMSWEELAAWLRPSGMSCAPHTVHHPLLPRLDAATQTREMSLSLEELRRRFPGTLPIIGYPFGLYDQSTLVSAREGGLEGGVTMDRYGTASGEDDLFRIPRIPIGGGSRLARMGVYLTAPWRRRCQNEWKGGFPRLP